jgi:membrane fusion protein (multidrug efflux system)
VLGTSVIAGRVTNVAPSGDAKARKFIAEIAPDRVDTLLPGMFVKVAVDVQEHQNVVAVPSTALTTRGDKTFVFVVQDNVAHQTPVETGLSNATLTEVGASVSAGANVVVQGLEGLNDGDHVNVLATQPAG